MMTPFPPKTVMQMRREALERANPKKAKPRGNPTLTGKRDPSPRPVLESENDRKLAATAWATYLRSGRTLAR